VRLLLDSHVLLWWDKDMSQLSGAQRAAIGDSDNEVFVSAVTAWELGIKSKSGKLSLVEPVSGLVRRFGFAELPVTLEHAEAVSSLAVLHKDPFDRMLMAQARVEGMVLVTVDRQIREYGVATL